MHRIAIAAACLAASSMFAACATVGPTRDSGPEGGISGVIKLPQGASASDVCTQLQVFAVNAQGQQLGDSSIHVGQGHCSYTLNYVEANVPVKLEVKSGSTSTCALKPAQLPSQLVLKDTESKLVDFALTCA